MEKGRKGGWERGSERVKGDSNGKEGKEREGKVLIRVMLGDSA